MSREYYGADPRTARRTRLGAVLVHAAVAATVGLASAVSGAAVALHLAAAPPAGPHLPRPGVAATPAAIPAAPVETPMIVAGAPSTAQATTADRPAIVSEPSATNPAASAPRPASQPLTERELTFAWGYAQRHPGAPSRQAEARVVPALASARPQGPATVLKREPRRPAERQRPSVAQHQAIALAPSGFSPGFDGDAHQALGYADERRANAVRVFSRGNPPPSPRNRNPSQSPQP